MTTVGASMIAKFWVDIPNIPIVSDTSNTLGLPPILAQGAHVAVRYIPGPQRGSCMNCPYLFKSMNIYIYMYVKRSIYIYAYIYIYIYTYSSLFKHSVHMYIRMYIYIHTYVYIYIYICIYIYIYIHIYTFFCGILGSMARKLLGFVRGRCLMVLTSLKNSSGPYTLSLGCDRIRYMASIFW